MRCATFPAVVSLAMALILAPGALTAQQRGATSPGAILAETNLALFDASPADVPPFSQQELLAFECTGGDTAWSCGGGITTAGESACRAAVVFIAAFEMAKDLEAGRSRPVRWEMTCPDHIARFSLAAEGGGFSQSLSVLDRRTGEVGYRKSVPVQRSEL